MNKSLLRIAFADDDADDHILFNKAIRHSYRVPIIDCFFTSSDFINFYAKSGGIIPHIIFLDKNMPGNYNYECLSLIKGYPLFHSVPVIIYSTSDFHTEIDEAMAIGASSYITKPTGFNETVRVLTQTIEKFVTTRFETVPLH